MSESIEVATLPGAGVQRRHLRHPVVRRILAAAAAGVFLLQFSQLSLPVALITWYGFLIVQMILFRRTRALGLLIVSVTLYGSTAWLALQYGQLHFPPWPSDSLVLATTRQDVAAIVLAYLLVEVVIGAERVQTAISLASAEFRRRIAVQRGTGADFVATTILLAIGVADWARVISLGLSTVLNGSRRQFAELLLLGGNHNVQVVAIAATVYLVSRAIVGRARVLGIVVTLLAWSPFLLVGSRKEAIETAVVLLLLWHGKMRLWQRVAVVLAVVVAFVSPALKTGVPYDALDEFILPQYMHFSTVMGLVPPDLGGTFAERALFLVPSFIRPIPLQDFGQAFGALGVTGVGIGASPFGEAALNGFWGSTELSFAVVFLAAVLVMVVYARRLPGAAIILFGLLAVYGRSDFWTTMFFALYIGLVLAALLPATRRASRLARSVGPRSIRTSSELQRT